MKKRLSTLLAAALLAATPAMAADAPPANGSAQIPFNCDFEPACEVAPGYYGNISAPASSKFNLSIGGFIKLDSAYYSTNFGPTAYFTPTNVPKNSSTAGQKDQTIFSVKQSRLWFKASGPTLLGAKTNGYLEFDFSNSNTDTTSSGNLNATPRLRHAYGNLDWGNTQVLFGQTSDLFGIISGNTIDFNSGSQAGFFGGTRNPQLRLTQRLNLNKDNSINFSVAVQQPYQSNFNNNGTNGAPGSTAGDSWGAKPNVTAQALFISKALGVSPGYYGQSLKNFTAGFTGLVGNQEVAGNNKSLDSWGASFYTFVPIISSADGRSRANTLTFEGQAYLAANVNGATAAQYVGTAGKLQEARGFGFGTHVIYYPIQNLGLSAGYGRRQASPTSDYKFNNYERYNETYFANASYDLNAAVRVAAEYQRFETKYGNVTNVTTAGSPLGGLSSTGFANIGRFALYYFF